MFGRLKQLFTSPEAAPPPPESQLTPDGANAEEASPAIQAFLRRDPIFDRAGRLVAHYFAFHEGSSHQPGDLLATLADQPPGWNHPLGLIPLAASQLREAAVDRLAGPHTAFLLDLDAVDPAGLCERMGELQDQGTLIGIARQPAHPAFAAAMAQADIAFLAYPDHDPDSVRNFSAAVRANEQARPVRLLATRIASADDYRFCHQWKFEWFHGPFAGEIPPNRPDNTGTDPHKIHLMNLLRLVQGDAETADIARAMKQDPMLSFRILRYLNSPLIGLSHPVDSINHALTILGRQRLTRWLSVLLFSVHEPGLGDWLLVESALTRGRLMELLGAAVHPRQANDELFMTGIFSCLDRLLHRPLADILTEIPVSQRICQALLERRGPYSDFLAIAEAGERYDLPALEAAARQAHLPAETVNQALLAATAWASEVTAHWE